MSAHLVIMESKKEKKEKKKKGPKIYYECIAKHDYSFYDWKEKISSK